MIFLCILCTPQNLPAPTPMGVTEATNQLRDVLLSRTNKAAENTNAVRINLNKLTDTNS